MTKTGEIRFEHVKKAYGNNVIIPDLDLVIKPNERTILLGPSGCGKTTTLRMIAGLEDISGGNLYMNGERVNDVQCGDRDIAMVFQNYALFPHMTVFKNIAFGLRTFKLSKAEIKARVDNMIHIMELDGLSERLPRELSGGQRQRVALARAAVKNASFFLLDEPLSNLDAQLRTQARKELVKLHEMHRPTFVYVTHDQIEAMTIGQNVVLMNKGRIQMQDTPYNIYHRPINIFTARFIGSPPMNIAKVDIDGNNISAGNARIPLSCEWKKQIGDAKRLYIGIRPENIALTNHYTEGSIEVVIKYTENYGNKLGIYFDIGESEFIAMQEQYETAEVGAKVYWRPDYSKLSFFDEQTKNNIGYPQEYLTSADTGWDPCNVVLKRGNENE